MRKRNIAVIGGGPAGLMAAISAARKGAFVTLFESGERVGKKILSTGNGKCNLGNQNLGAEYYCGSSQLFIDNALKQFDTGKTEEFFAGLGLLVKNKNGYLYPYSEQASTVLDVLRMEIRRLRVMVLTDKKVTALEKEGIDEFVIHTQDKKVYGFESVIIACGGQAAPKTGSDGNGYKLAEKMGHNIVPTVPALVQLRCEGDFWRSIAGVRCDASLHCDDFPDIEAERGELQLTDYGISGIPVFQLSRKMNYILKEKKKVHITIDFLSDYTETEIIELGDRKKEKADKHITLEEYFTGVLNKKIMLLLIKQMGLKPTQLLAETSLESIHGVYRLCKNFTAVVVGNNGFEHAQTTAGGVDTEELTEYMESKLVPGLYFAGEIIDVDGRCGGYNLQWAWTSGYLAGTKAAGDNR